MKKLHTCAFLTAAIASLAIPFFGATDVSAAASVSYKDFSQLDTKLNNTYAYTKVYWTDDTKITVVKAAGNAPLGEVTKVSDHAYRNYSYIKQGESLTLLIENSTAVDAQGKKMDVLYKVSGVKPWNEGNDNDGNPNSYAIISLDTQIYGSSAATHPQDDLHTITELKAGDPIVAWNQAHNADSLFSVQFCKKGTYVASSDSCTPAGINNVSSAHWDFDVPNANRDNDGNITTYANEFLKGNEGIVPQTGSTTIYYDKNAKATDVTLRIADSGFSVDGINGASFNGIYYANSIFTTTTGLTNSTWTYRYGGTGCGAGFMFGSAVPYNMPKPVKSVDKTTAKKGDKLTFKIRQEVPNNYSSEADITAFMSLWSNYNQIVRSKLYTGFTISDSFDEHLIPPSKEAIKVADENGKDVTANFTITISGNTVSAVAKAASGINFYGHIYTVTIPTTVKSPITVSPIENLAKTVYTPEGGSDITLISDPVEVKIQHTVTVIYIDDETEEELADGYEKDYDHGAHYDTEESDEIPDHYVLVADPDNASGTVNDDITVIYRYTPPYTVTVCWIDDETGKEFVECTEEEYGKGDEYTTNPLEENPKDYQLVGTPDNATGTVNGDVKVIYRYRKIKNPKTIDGSFGTFVVIAASSVAGFGLYFGLKQRR